MAEFDGRRAPNVVSNVVRGAAQDLAATPAGEWVEMVERAARQRLLEPE